MSDDNFVWLDTPIHKNCFLGSLFEDEELVSSLKVSFDGTIMAVKRDMVEGFYNDQEVDLMKAGYKEYPKKVNPDDSDSFYKSISLYITL